MQSTAWSHAGCRKCCLTRRDHSRTRKSHKGASRYHSVKFIVNAAASMDTTVDIKQMLQQALETPSKPNRLANTPGAAASSVKTQGLDTSNLPSPGAADQGFLGQMGPTAEGVKSQATPTVQAIKSQAAPAAEAVKSQAQDVASDKVEPITQGLQPSAPPSKLAETVQSAGEQLQSQLKSTADSFATPDIVPAEAVNNASQQLNEATSSAVQSVQDASGSLLDSINQAVPGLQSSVESAASTVSSQVSGAASSMMEALPAPAAEALQAAAAAVQPTTDKLWAYVSSDPKAGAAATGLAVGLPLLAFWRARLAGYSGQLQPAKALQLLNKSNSLLIDIRKEETRNVEGVPLLKRGSRGKGAAIPIQAITAAAARSARQGQSLRLQIVALQILGLKQVRRGTILVVMDQNGGADAIAIARSVRELARRKVYVVAGGFRAWEKQGLDIQSSGINYQTTVFDSLSDEAESLVESATSFFRDPVIAAGGVGGAVLAGVALVDWHYALRYVGVLGTQLTLFNWLTSYDSPQNALSDAGSTLQKYSQKVTALVGSRSQTKNITQGSDVSYEQSPSADDGSEQAADSEQRSAPSARSEEASVPRSS
ncbi:hypothetical protein WJX77_011344 [Trebouxia sp. C0004]